VPIRWPTAAHSVFTRPVAGWAAMSPRERIGVAAVGALVAAMVVLLLIFDWNWLRGPVGAAITDCP